MFDTLRKKLEELAADLNPFDNGRTGEMVRRERVQPARTVTVSQQPTQPAQTRSRPFNTGVQNFNAPFIKPMQPTNGPKVTSNPLKDISDFVAGSNEKFLGGAARGIVNTANLVGSGFNADEAERRTNDFLRTTGQTNQQGMAPLSQGANRDSAAFKSGQNVGSGQKIATDIATAAIPGAAVEKGLRGAGAIARGLQSASTGTRLAARVAPVVGGGVVSSAINQVQNPTQNAGQNFATGAAIDAASALLGPGLSAASRLLRGGTPRTAGEVIRQAPPTNTATTMRSSVVAKPDVVGTQPLPAQAVQETPLSPSSVITQEPGTGVSRLMNRASRANQLGPELQATIANRTPVRYERVTNAGQIARSEELLGRGVNKAYTDVNERLAAKNIDNQTVSDSIALIKRLDESTNANDLQRATDMVEKLSEKLTSAGQTVQAARLLSNRTPQGLFYGAVRDLKKAGVEVTPQLQSRLQELVDVVKRSPAGTPEGDLARFNVAKFVNDNVPSKISEKIMNFWRAGLLTGPQTTAGNILGNTGETVARKLFVNPVATAVDAAIGAFTGKRTQTLGGGFAGGAKEGAGKLGQFLKTGYDERDALSKYDTRLTNYGDGKLGKTLNAYVNGVYKLMSVADQPFWYGARQESLKSLAKAEALNKGVPRSERAAFIDDFVFNPSEEALERATREAMYATFQNKTGLGQAALGFKEGLNKVVPGLGDFIIPFTQVPASIATRIIQRTPVGTATELAKQIINVKKGGKFDQRAMVQSIGEGAFGTAVLASGYALANSGLLTFGYPDDPKERELWEAEGKQPYSIRVGDRWYSLNYIQPFGTQLAIGGQAANSVKDGADAASTISSALATAGQSVMNQSFLKGVSGVLDAIDDPKRYAGNLVENTAGSVVPNAVRAFARANDPLQRDPSGAAEGIQSAIPGVREGLPAKQDMFGAPLEAKDSFVNQFVNPLRPSVAKDADVVVNELRRLKDIDEGVLPAQAQKNAFKDVSLTKDQVREINSLAGPKLKEMYAAVINDSRYKNLTDEEKNKAIKEVNDTVFGSIKASYGLEKDLVPEDKIKLDTNQKRYLGGKTVDFLSAADDKRTFQEEYDDAVKRFEEDSSTMSKVERVKRKDELSSLAVKKDFDRDTVDLYGMSKDDVYRLVSSESNGNKMVENILKYGDALVAAGVSKTNKFRDKRGNVSLKDPNSRSSGGGRGGRKKNPNKGKFDYKLAGFSQSGSSNSKQLYDLLKKAQLTRRKNTRNTV